MNKLNNNLKDWLIFGEKGRGVRMKLRKTIALFSIIVGMAMLGISILQLLTGQAPELQSAPIEIALALTADGVTAIMLLVSGIGLLTMRIWAEKLYLFALGMLVYSVLISSGYFGQAENTVFVVLFAVLFLLSTIFITVNVFPKKH